MKGDLFYQFPADARWHIVRLADQSRNAWIVTTICKIERMVARGELILASKPATGMCLICDEADEPPAPKPAAARPASVRALPRRRRTPKVAK